MRKSILTCGALACALFPVLNVIAQSQFITPATIPSLSQKQQGMLNRVQKNPIYKTWQWVTLGKITDFQDTTGVLSFTIPRRPGVIHVSPKSIKATSASNYEWYGNVNDNDTTG